MPCDADTTPKRMPTGRRASACARLPGLASACALAFACAFALADAAHAARPWRVVILHGADPAQPAAMQQDRAFRRMLEAAAPDGVEFYTDPLDGLRFQGAELMPEFLALLTRKYQRREVDLVVGVADFALDFAERYHAQLWPG